MTVNVKVRLLGVLRGAVGRRQLSIKLERPTVEDVVLAVAKVLKTEDRGLLIDPELNDPRSSVLILLNGQEINVLNGLSTKISENDEVTFIPVAHGG
jgi:molybdopterin converting factor small subunit